MKTIIDVKLPEKSSILVTIGDKVTCDTPIAEASFQSPALVIDLAKMLKVSPSKINKYIIVDTDQKLHKGEVMARKKGIISTTVALSPSDGFIEDIDTGEGLIVYKEDKHDEKKIYAPVAGIVKDIKPRHIGIECDGMEYFGEKSHGGQKVGILTLIKGEQVGVLDVDQEISRSIILAEEVTAAAIAKIDVLGGKGIIATKIPDDTSLDYILVTKSTFDRLIDHNGCETIVDPSKKKIFILI